jgi:hypothetical protein
MNTTTSQYHFPTRIFDSFCPFDGVATCLASLSSMVLDNSKRKMSCGTDNFDDCPIFLSKVLRWD